MKELLHNTFQVIRILFGALFVLFALVAFGQLISMFCFTLLAALCFPRSHEYLIQRIPQIKPLRFQVLLFIVAFIFGMVMFAPPNPVDSQTGSSTTGEVVKEDIFQLNNNLNQNVDTVSTSIEAVSPSVIEPVAAPEVVEQAQKPLESAPLVVPLVVPSTPTVEKSVPEAPKQMDRIKKSTSNICHEPEGPYYLSVEKFTSFDTLEACLASGGRLPNTPEAIKVPDPVTSSPVVKKSTSGICHAPGTTYYARTKNYRSFPTLEACLSSGGRLPKR